MEIVKDLDLIPIDKLEKCLDKKSFIVSHTCPNCRHWIKEAQAFPYAYDTKNDWVIYAVKCEQCGMIYFITEQELTREVFTVVAIANKQGNISDKQYCTNYYDKEEAIKAAEEYAWELAGDNDVDMVYVFGGYYEDGNGNFRGVNRHQVFVTCNHDYTEPPIHIKEKIIK